MLVHLRKLLVSTVKAGQEWNEYSRSGKISFCFSCASDLRIPLCALVLLLLLICMFQLVPDIEAQCFLV